MASIVPIMSTKLAVPIMSTKLAIPYRVIYMLPIHISIHIDNVALVLISA